MTLTLLAVAVALSATFIGLLPAMVNGVQKSLQVKLQLPDGRVEWFVRLFYLGWLAMPVAGLMLETLPGKAILFAGLVAVILGLAWLALVRTTAALAMNGAFLGIGYSCVTTATVSFMPVAFYPDYAHTYNLQTASLNLGFMMVGLGALVGPWLVVVMERWWGYRQGLLYASMAAILPAVLVAICDADRFPPPPETIANWLTVFTRPQMAWIALAILIYYALESTLEFWPPAFLKSLGYHQRGIRFNLAIFCVAFIVTRGAAAWWFYWHPSHAVALTIMLVVIAALAFFNLASGFDIGGGTLGFWLLGAAYGPLLPCILGMAMQRPIPASGLGGLLALGGLDMLLVRPGMSTLSKDRPIRSAMWAPMFLSLALWVPLLFAALWPSRL